MSLYTYNQNIAKKTINMRLTRATRWGVDIYLAHLVDTEFAVL